MLVSCQSRVENTQDNHLRSASTQVPTPQPLTPVPSSGSLTQLPASGTDDFFVGGRFDISPTTAVQAYTGTVSLSIDFN